MIVPAIEREWYCVQCPRVPFTVNDRIDIIFSVVKIPHGPATNVIFLNCPLTTRYDCVSGVYPGGRDACRKRGCWVMDANDVWCMYLYRTCTLESTPVFDGSSQISIVGRKEKGNDWKDKRQYGLVITYGGSHSRNVRILRRLTRAGCTALL